jgi:hypothetical protein
LSLAAIRAELRGLHAMLKRVQPAPMLVEIINDPEQRRRSGEIATIGGREIAKRNDENRDALSPACSPRRGTARAGRRAGAAGGANRRRRRR